MENARVESLLFADDIARLASSGAGLQRAPNRFAAECTMTGMQMSTKKTEVIVLSRQKKQCAVNVNGIPLNQAEKFKYFGVQCSNDARYLGLTKSSCIDRKKYEDKEKALILFQ